MDVVQATVVITAGAADRTKMGSFKYLAAQFREQFGIVIDSLFDEHLEYEAFKERFGGDSAYRITYHRDPADNPDREERLKGR